jgi:HD-GYP domain-containing protein (c-di-GMP phosphodiesterase class II)
MISSRPYRKGLPMEEAIRRLRADMGRQFDPIVTPKFIALASNGASTVFDATGASLASAL